ncbi:F-box/WD repeat-containing protein 11-like isoform X2 [Teleopsis dalmanni]|uniref:F-box/WD repeat-containing protein 11-like isoform X2 n=1 Tax=Teleopsis dalmanni TaxID=139649 RepID=UPI0018CE2436|nr:F-box/WD repeat-containing protein 11-like isoform X2 [Teleopsis dalmanni]
MTMILFRYNGSAMLELSDDLVRVFDSDDEEEPPPSAVLEKSIIDFDFVQFLIDKNLNHVAGAIFAELDPKTLRAASFTCRKWRQVIFEEKVWYTVFMKKIKTSTIWADLAECNGWEKIKSADNLTPKQRAMKCRHLCNVIEQQIQNTTNNWNVGRYTLIRAIHPPNTVVSCLRVDETRVLSVIGNLIQVRDRARYLRCEKLEGHECKVLALQFHAQLAVSADNEGYIKFWCLETKKSIYSMQNDDAVAINDLRFRDEILVTGDNVGIIGIWAMNLPSEVTLIQNLIGHEGSITCLDLSDKMLVSGCTSCVVKVWSMETRENLYTLLGHTERINCIKLSNNLIVSGSADKTARIWNAESGICMRVLVGHTGAVTAVTFNDVRLITGASNGYMKAWNMKAALDPHKRSEYLCTYTLHEHSSAVTNILCDEFHMFSCASDNAIIFWNFLCHKFLTNNWYSRVLTIACDQVTMGVNLEL